MSLLKVNNWQLQGEGRVHFHSAAECDNLVPVGQKVRTSEKNIHVGRFFDMTRDSESLSRGPREQTMLNNTHLILDLFQSVRHGI